GGCAGFNNGIAADRGALNRGEYPMHHAKSRTQRLGPLGLLTATALTLVLAACNGDGSDVTGTVPDPGAPAEPVPGEPTEPARVTTLEYFTGGYTGDGGLFAVPPSSPSAYENVDPQADVSSTAYHTFDIIPIVAAQST